MIHWRSTVVTVLLLLLLFSCVLGVKQSNWPDLGVGVDKIGITKKLIADCCFRGHVRSIQLGNFDNDGDLEIAVVPQSGVYLFDTVSLKKKAQFDFKKADGKILWFGLSPYLVSHSRGFLIAMLGRGYGDIGLLDQSGKELWKFRPSRLLPPDGMVVDDAISQQPRFYVCDREMIYRLDSTGSIVWKVAENANYITLVRDQKNTEAGFATAAYRSRTLNVWSATGKLLQKIDLPFYPDGIVFVQMGSISGFVVKSRAKLVFLDRSGKQLFSYNYGDVPIYHGPTAVLVRLALGQPPILAIRLESSSATGKSVLTLLSLDGSLLYEEYMDGGSSLGVSHINGENRDRLFVGEGTNRLWVYEKTSSRLLN